MSNAAQEPAASKDNIAGKKSDARSGAKDAISARAAHVSVPEVPGAVTRASGGGIPAWRFGAVMAALSIFAGSLTWYVESLAPPSSDSSAVVSATNASAAIPSWADPLPPHVRQSIDQELRLAALALDLRENQENLSRLLDEARSLHSTIGDLTSGMRDLRAKIGETRTDTVAGLARVEERLHEVELTASESSSEASLSAQRDADVANRVQRLEAQLPIIEANAAAPPIITGALPEASAGPKATVKVAFSKPRARSPKPIPGWYLHSVRDDLALVGNDDAHYEVRRGELLPGAGIVRSIKNRGQGWVVVTSRGVITEPR
jgi:hypothetical protein